MMNVGFFLSSEPAPVAPDTPISAIRQRIAGEKYLVVKDSGGYVGLLTQADVLRSDGETVTECLTEKPFVPMRREVGEVLNLLIERGIAAVPVADDEGKYVGTISFDDIVNILCGIVNARIDISFTNIVGSADVEQAKQSFIAQMQHNIKNPLQVIYSALRLLENDAKTQEHTLLIHAIENNLRRIDLLMNDLTKQYLCMGRAAEATARQ